MVAGFNFLFDIYTNFEDDMHYLDKGSLLNRLKAFVFCLCIIAPHASSAQEPGCSGAFLENAPLQHALFSGQWQVVYDHLKATSDCDLDAPSILLLAHATLASGSDINEASLLFSVVKDSTDLAVWNDWAASLHQHAPQNRVARYLLGDAHARVGDFTSALRLWNEILEDEAFILAQNARGVLYSIMYQIAGEPAAYHLLLEYASTEFQAAIRAQPEFVDAMANQALVFIESNRLPGARTFFDRAIEADSTFALAYNGRAVLILAQDKDKTKASEDVLVAHELLPSYPFIALNAKAIADPTDTTSTLRVLANVYGKNIHPDSLYGTKSASLAVEFSTRESLGQSIRTGVDAAKNFFTELGHSAIRITQSAIEGTMRIADQTKMTMSASLGGMYLAAQISGGTQRVEANMCFLIPGRLDRKSNPYCKIGGFRPNNIDRTG